MLVLSRGVMIELCWCVLYRPLQSTFWGFRPSGVGGCWIAYFLWRNQINFHSGEMCGWGVCIASFFPSIFFFTKLSSFLCPLHLPHLSSGMFFLTPHPSASRIPSVLYLLCVEIVISGVEIQTNVVSCMKASLFKDDVKGSNAHAGDKTSREFWNLGFGQASQIVKWLCNKPQSLFSKKRMVYLTSWRRRSCMKFWSTTNNQRS